VQALIVKEQSWEVDCIESRSLFSLLSFPGILAGWTGNCGEDSECECPSPTLIPLALLRTGD
jgi:hypothetical protein